LQLALDVNFGALLEILFGDLAEPFIEDDHAVPLGLFLALAGRLVAPAFGGRDTEIGNRPPILGTPDFRILAEISDQNHLVHASCHRRSPFSKTLDWPDAQLSARALASSALGPPLNRPYTLPAPASPMIPRLSTYSMPRQNVPVLFYLPGLCIGSLSLMRLDWKMAEFWWQKVPSQIREMLNKSLAYGRLTSLASVAFRRRHFRPDSDKLLA